MLLGDQRLNTITLIVENNHVKKHSMDFYYNLKLGTISKLINPSFEGYVKDMHVLKCEGIVHSNDLSFNIKRQIRMNNISDYRCLFSKFTTKCFQVKIVMINEILCSGACDGRHSTNCY